MANKKEELNVVSNDPVDPIDTKPVLKEDDKAPAKKTDEKEPATEEVPIDDDVEDEAAPPQPPRPVDPITKITTELKDAFPGIDEKYITAVLIASQGEVDPAFNALLYISDPSFKPEIPVPSLGTPKGPAPSSRKGTTLTDDELLARKLQKEFELEDERRRRRDKRKHQKQHQQQQPAGDESGDDFDQIKETFTQGLEEARTTLNGWVSGIAKKFDSNPDQQKQNPKLFSALGGSSFNNDNKRKTNRFDEDPQILSNDFNNRISLTDNDNDKDLPHLPQRAGSNHSKTTTTSAPQSDTPADTKNPSKWQPLNSDVPANSDAFLVTDSEDEDTGVANYDVKKK